MTSSAERRLADYRAMAMSAERMHVLALEGQWSEVGRLSLSVQAFVAELEAEPEPVPFTPDQSRERARIMTRVIEIDAAIRHLRQPWVSRLDRLLNPGSHGLGSRS